MMNAECWHPKGEHPMTREGNRKFKKFMLSSGTMSGVVKFVPETKNIIANRMGSESYEQSTSVAFIK